MNQQELKDILDHHYRELDFYIKKIAENFDVEDIHHFRVEYKKLRAILRMLSNQHKAKLKVKIDKNLEKYYQIAGEIRDLQLLQQRILANTLPGSKKIRACLDVVRLQIEKFKLKLDDHLFDSALKGCKHKTTSAIPKHFLIKNFKDFAKQRWQKVDEISSCSRLSNEKIHVIRKNLKDLFYNLKLYSGDEKEQLSEAVLKGKKLSDLDQFLNELGNYHDLCIAILLLKANRFTGLNLSNRKLLERLKIQWKKDQLYTRHLLVKQLKTNIAQHEPVFSGDIKIGISKGKKN